MTTTRRIGRLFARFLAERDGATVVEYMLLVGIFSAALIGVLGGFQTGLADFFTSISNKLTTSTPQ